MPPKTDHRAIRDVLSNIEKDVQEATLEIVAPGISRALYHYCDLGSQSFPVASALNEHFGKGTWMNLRGEAVE